MIAYTLRVDYEIPRFDDGYPKYYYAIHNIHLARWMAAVIRSKGHVVWIEPFPDDVENCTEFVSILNFLIDIVLRSWYQ